MCIRDRLSVRYSMNFWRRGVGLEWIFVIARSLELQALPYALNRPPRAAASFNRLLERFRVPRPRIVEKNGQRMPCQRELSFCQRLLDFRRPRVSPLVYARAS